MSTPTAAPLVARGRHVVELDGLRFVLVIAILLFRPEGLLPRRLRNYFPGAGR